MSRYSKIPPRKFFARICLFSALSLFAFLLFDTAVEAYDVSGNSTADINTALSLSELDDLQFGKIYADQAGDTIELRANGNILISGGSQHDGDQQRERFRITGTLNSNVTLSLSPSNILTGPGQDIPFYDLVANKASSFTLNTNGRRNFRVGGKIDINPTQVNGTYSGTYQATVNYQ